MAQPRLSLDHAGCIVRDLDAGQARWERLGFTLSPRSDQLGLDATGEFVPWASANHCAVFEVGYLELIGIVRPDAPNQWTAFLERFEGAHIAALRCDSGDAAHAAIAARSDEFNPPLQRRREAPYFEDGRWGTRTMGFRNIFSRDEVVAECRYIVIEHQTPEVLWQPCLLDHPNGAKTIESLTFCAHGSTVLHRIESLTGLAAARDGTGGLLTLEGGGSLEVVSPAGFAERYAGASPPATPSIAAVTVGVDDPTATAVWLTEHGVAIHRDGERLWVERNDANGTIIEFKPRSRA